MLYRHPELHLMPKKSGGKSKAHRLVNELGPWLRVGRLRISTADTKFLSALRSFLNRYPAVSEHDPGWDAADAVYLALCGMPDTLAMGNPDNEFPLLGQKKKHSAQPWSHLRSN
jgi:hypothetical protein